MALGVLAAVAFALVAELWAGARVGGRQGARDVIGQRWSDGRTAILQLGFTSAVVLVVAASAVSPSRLPTPIALATAVAGVGVGTGLRVWAIVSLGRWFDRDGRVRTGQPRLATGPYQLVRHPAYIGNIVFVTALAVAATSAAFAVVVLTVVVVAHLPRIASEEHWLRHTPASTGAELQHPIMTSDAETVAGLPRGDCSCTGM